jgi:hypothetical protein
MAGYIFAALSRANQNLWGIGIVLLLLFFKKLNLQVKKYTSRSLFKFMNFTKNRVMCFEYIYTLNGINLYIYVSWQKAIGSWQVLLPTALLPTAN